MEQLDLILDETEMCDKPVAVLGDDLIYPCALLNGHAGRCEPDYEMGRYDDQTE